MIKILDCTLRDGGYLNNWSFGKQDILSVIKTLSESGIDVIEGGFLSDIKKYDENCTLFNNAFLFNDYKQSFKTPFALMLNFGEDTSSMVFDKTTEIRLAFKQYQLKDVFDFVRPLSEEGYLISLNPMHIGLYSDEELNLLAEITNSLNPACLTAVDTMGIMRECDVFKIFGFLDEKLNNNIPLGFHSHNNLNLSKENVLRFISMDLKRDIIIDTSLSGLSRGGGMLPTEDLAEYLNMTRNKDYNIRILKETGKYLKDKLPNDSDTKPYYLSAEYKCHPNYAKYLISAHCPIDNMSEIFEQIPEKNKTIYSSELIERLYPACKST